MCELTADKRAAMDDYYDPEGHLTGSEDPAIILADFGALDSGINLDVMAAYLDTVRKRLAMESREN